MMPSPVKYGSGTLNGNPSFTFRREVIRDRITRIDPTHIANDSGQSQHAFCDGGFAGVDYLYINKCVNMK
jgi:hypothetical protein